MRRFRYWRDPLFLSACALYGVNRWFIKPATDLPFFHDHLNDLLLIPAALPLVLWMQRRLSLRRTDNPPSWREIGLHVLVWALLAEAILPAFLPWATGDALDAAAYALGGLCGGLFWHFHYKDAPGFDLLAPYYAWLECLLAGEILQHSRTRFFPNPQDRILLVGEGHGRFLEAVLERQAQTLIVCLEESPRMVEAARSRLRKRRLSEKNVIFLQQDILSWKPSPAQFDCIVTHFFLDCFDGQLLEDVIQKLSACAKPEATWLLADFQIPAALLPRLRARAIVWLMLHFFRWMTRLPARRLENPGPLLEEAGFRLQAREECEWGLVHAASWRRSPLICA